MYHTKNRLSDLPAYTFCPTLRNTESKKLFFPNPTSKKLLKEFHPTERLKPVRNNSSSTENSSLLTLPGATHR